MTIDFAALAAEFPRDVVSWRAQTVSKNGDKALALAYIDARDVMRRLDDVCTLPAGRIATRSMAARRSAT
jgi:hypothetical protein